MVAKSFNCFQTIANVVSSSLSGLARSLRTSAFSRPSTTRRAFQSIKKNFAPALGARFASTDVRDGKIHQVIGAVVDGEPDSPYRLIGDIDNGCVEDF